MSAQQNGVSHPYTCNTCMVAFKGSELQRGHMQSDWHRYNLKRRVASLPPLSSEVFTEKVLANQATAEATAAKATFEKLCPACSKTYFSENAFRNHLNSQKHRQQVARMQGGSVASTTEDGTHSVMSSSIILEDPSETRSAVTEDEAAEQEFSQVVDSLKKTELKDKPPVLRRPSRPHHSASQDKEDHPLSPSSEDEDEDDAAETTNNTEANDSNALQKCLFCNTGSESISSNVDHMKLKHGLFVPEQDYLVDLEGLIKWLHDRVSFLHECLYCGMVRHTTSGIQTHMRDKGHCMIAFDSEEQMVEVGQFYDFTSTYSDDESEDEEDEEGVKLNAGPQLGSRREVETVQINGGSVQNAADDAGWETDEEEDGGVEPRQKKKARVAAAQPVYHDEDGLHLPSGRTAGHRSLARYFRQNLHNYPTVEERVSRRVIADSAAGDEDETMSERTVTPTGNRDQQVTAISRANGGLGMVGVSDAKKTEIKKQEKRDWQRAARQENRYRAGVERRGNQQKHFRDPLLQ